MKTIYCISGLGADERAFSRLKLSAYNVVYLPWVMPLLHETIQQYALRMSAGIKDKNCLLMGLSFGGMMCIEIAKLIGADKVILISSISTVKSIPRWLKNIGKLKINKLFPMRSFKILEPVQNLFLGVTDKAVKEMVRDYRKNSPTKYNDWAINQIVNWQNTWQPSKLYHIHGDSDHTFPIKYISATHIVKGGGHFMIMNNADQVNIYLKEILLALHY